ncbi:MAG: ABC transporter substrate-binding protein [Desulfuromonadales bacterium]|nr:ABC transporter substrate-binding protein [Desulfuromonadales bacterium]
MKVKCFVIMLFLLLACSVSYAVEIALITDKNNPVDSISAKDAKNIFLGKKKSWDGGGSVTPVIQKNASVTEAFTRSIVKKSSAQYTLFWRKAIFTGTGTPPVEVEDDAAMKKMVAAKSGAVGYISADALDGSVKKLNIN